MAKPTVRLNGAIVRTLREAGGFSVPQFVAKSGYTDRVLRKIENENAPVETSTAQCIAKLLNVKLDAIRLSEDDVARTELLARLHKSAKPRTRLEELVSREREAGLVKRRASHTGDVAPRLLAHDLQDIFSAYRLHATHRFHVEGIVDQHRGIGVAEARVIGTESGTGARFHIITEVLPDASMAITVHTRTEDQTRTLLDARRTCGLVRVDVHVMIAPSAHTAVHGAAPAPVVPAMMNAEEFKGFGNFVSDTTHPWAFVVDAATVVSLPPDAK